MARVAPRVPELSEILCSRCGYVLNGLNNNGVCPECGHPIEQSLGNERIPPAWESPPSGNRFKVFVTSTMEIILRPARFYRTLNVRGSVAAAQGFARIHWWIAGAMFALAGSTHAVWFSYRVAPMAPDFPGGPWAMFAILLFGLTLLTYVSLDWITRLAGRLTTLEATYRGLRLPYTVVLRGMYYHSAHYVPVGVAALVLVEGYQLARTLFAAALPFNSPMIYLYALCALVVISALYLFQTYWIGMRNMMYANR